MARSEEAKKLRKEFGLDTIYRLHHLTMGADPEFFFSTPKNGFVRGAERVIPEDGIGKRVLYANGAHFTDKMFVLDGVQAELHPKPCTCRAYFGNDIKLCFMTLRNELEKNDIKLKPNFSSVVHISKKELNSLSEQSRVFGCKPSHNVYGDEDATVSVSAASCTSRWAGGHIHLGAEGAVTRKVLKDRKRLVPVLDILLGNTCVLLDREPMAAERRKVYGRAGENRLTSYGIEYRTLSNFWLRSYPLASFVLNMARFCVAIVKAGDNYVKALMSLVDIDDVEKAINTNDIDLAYKNFQKIATFFEAIDIRNSDYDDPEKLPTEASPFAFESIEQFLFMASKGVDHWFDADVMEHWCNIPEGHHCGWETFMENQVEPEYTEWVESGRKPLGSSIL